MSPNKFNFKNGYHSGRTSLNEETTLNKEGLSPSSTKIFSCWEQVLLVEVCWRVVRGPYDRN